jgi:4-amino-4-deoxy-L-arabinose transferase-like glycosyltransferase
VNSLTPGLASRAALEKKAFFGKSLPWRQDLSSLATASVLIGIGCVAVTAILLATRKWGIGVVADSTVYITAARSLLSNGSLQDYDSFGGAVPLVHYPPLLPILLAAISWVFRIDPIAAARALGAALFGMNVTLLGVCTWRLLKSAGLGIIMSVLALIFTPMIDLHLMALSEPLYFLFSLAVFFFIIRYLQDSTISFLLLASCATGLAFFTRYAGVSLVASGVLAIVIVQRKSPVTAIRNAAVFGALGSLLTALWLAGNHSLAATQSDNFFGKSYIHTIDVKEIVWGIHTFSTWFIPGLFSIALQVMFVAFVVSGLAVAYYSKVSGRNLASGSSEREIRDDDRICVVALLFIVCYLAVVISTMWFLDATTRLDDRILLPLFPSIAILLLVGARKFSSLRLFGRPARLLPALVVVLMFLTNAPRSAARLVSFARVGRGYTAQEWHNSRLIEALQSVPPEVPIYTTLPSSVRFLSGRVARQLPNTYNPRTYQQNRAYVQEIAAMRDAGMQSGIVLVYFAGDSARWYPSELEITGKLNLRLLAEDQRGSLYVSPLLLQKLVGDKDREPR